MQLNVPVDIADVLQEALNAYGHDACARPVPGNLGAVLPLTLVEPMGGTRSDVVLDRFGVRLYTWGGTEEAAIAESRAVMATLCAHAGDVLDGTTLYEVIPAALPYPAHDTEHPDIPRACFTAYVRVRAQTIETTT